MTGANKDMFVAAIIPARGGSKSIPKKNILNLSGKPLLQYSIEYAQHSTCVDYIFVSSDCPETIAIAQSLGVETPFKRPEEFADDDARDYGFMRHALDVLEDHLGREIDLFALLRPTSPLRPLGLIEKAVAIMEQHPDATSVRSVAATDQHPYRQFLLENETLFSPFKGFIDDDEPYNIPRQHLPEFYFQTGDLELVRRSTLLNGSVSGDKICGLIIDKNEMLDIDEFNDFDLAKAKLEKS